MRPNRPRLASLAQEILNNLTVFRTVWVFIDLYGHLFQNIFIERRNTDDYSRTRVCA